MKTILLAFIAGFTFSAVSAQYVTPQVLNTTGGTYQKGYYALDWSIGEVPLVDAFSPSGGNYIVTNGYLQSFTENPKFNILYRAFDEDEIVILPNPTAGRLEVNFLMHETGEAQMTLYDAVGGRLLTRRVSLFGYGKFERLDLTGYAGSTYFLHIDFKSSTGPMYKKGSYKITKIK